MHLYAELTDKRTDKFCNRVFFLKSENILLNNSICLYFEKKKIYEPLKECKVGSKLFEPCIVESSAYFYTQFIYIKNQIAKRRLISNINKFTPPGNGN